MKELTGRSRQAGSTGEMVSDDSEDETYATGAEEESQWIQELISIVLSGSRHAVCVDLSYVQNLTKPSQNDLIHTGVQARSWPKMLSC